MENIDGWECFTHAHPILVKMCEIIIYGGSDFLQYCDGWTADDKKNALAHLKCLECFEFIYCVITVSHCFVYLKEAVVKIQGKGMDIIAGVSLIMECCNELTTIWRNIYMCDVLHIQFQFNY